MIKCIAGVEPGTKSQGVTKELYLNTQLLLERSSARKILAQRSEYHPYQRYQYRCFAT